jgi:hypothetical protein
MGVTGTGGGLMIADASANDFCLYTNTQAFRLSTNAGTNTMLQVAATTGLMTVGRNASGVTHSGHIFYNGNAAGSPICILQKTTGADTASNYYMTFKTDTADQGYIWNDGSGNIALLTASDVNLKENIRDADYGLNEILALRPVIYDWKNGSAQNAKGFIAQEVEPILPYSVTTMPDGNKGMSTQEFIPVLVSAIKEQNALIVALQARIAALEDK